MRDEAAREAEQRLFGLMAVAEEQQAAVRDAPGGLAATRTALAQDRAQLGEAVEVLRAEAERLRRTAGQLGPELAQSTTVAAKEAVKGELASAGATATTAVETAAQPLLTQLSGVATQAGAVEASSRRVAIWASWRLLGRGVILVAVMAGLLWLANLSVWWWTERDLDTLHDQRTALQTEVDVLRAGRDQLKATQLELVRAGLLAKISHCDPGGRPCIRVDEKAGAFGDPADYRVILGY